MIDELFTVYYCKSCNRIEITQYISPEEMKILELTPDELQPSCPVTGATDLEELGQMTEKELREFAKDDISSIRSYLSAR